MKRTHKGLSNKIKQKEIKQTFVDILFRIIEEVNSHTKLTKYHYSTIGTFFLNLPSKI